VFTDAAGNVFASAGDGRTAVLNTPGGGLSRNQRRPDLIPGVNPFTESDGILFLNPAAFSIPKPGEFGSLERNSIHGPNFKQVDAVIARRIGVGGGRNFELRWEIFNIFNTVNFDAASLAVSLPNALPTTALGSANTVQPGQAYTPGAAGTFGRVTSTVGRTVGLGTPRQMQFAARFSF
jgi:hypothetical protein